jgi:hypothetical protein
MVKRVILIVVGVIFIVGGGLVATAGGALMGVFGSDNTLSSGIHQVTTPSTALVAPMDDIKGTKGIASAVDNPTLRVTVNNPGKDVFVGVGPAADVDQYLAGAAYDKVTDLELDPFRLVTTRQNGSNRPGAPGDQSFWTVHANGAQATVDWQITDGSYRLVVMNADTNPGVNVNGQFALKVPNLFAVGLGVLLAGIVGVVIGIALLVIGIRIPSRRRPPDALAYGPPGAGGYGPPGAGGYGPPGAGGYGPPGAGGYGAPPAPYGPPGGGYGPPAPGFGPPPGPGGSTPPRADPYGQRPEPQGP